jgi:hypothetical protein
MQKPVDRHQPIAETGPSQRQKAKLGVETARFRHIEEFRERRVLGSSAEGG